MAEEYTPKAILVTGGAGFIGSHVVHACLQAWPNVSIVVFDIMDPMCSNVKNIETALSTGRCQLIRGDVRDQRFLLHVLTSKMIDTVMHFAAQTHVDNSLAGGNALEFTSTNTMGTHILLESVRQYNLQCKPGVQRFVHVSTDETYGGESVVACTEDSAFYPSNPYAASKVGAEAQATAYHRSHGLPVIITRGNNTIGPCQSLEKLVPKFITRRLRGLPLPIHGDGEQLRSFLHVADVAQAFVCVLKRGTAGSVYNIAADGEQSVNMVARKIVELLPDCPTPDGQDPIVHVRDRLFNDRRYLIDSTKLRSLGWRQQRSFEQTIADCVNWFRAHQKGYWSDDCEAKLLRPHPDETDFAPAAATTTF